jgi:hypothetical protein
MTDVEHDSARIARAFACPRPRWLDNTTEQERKVRPGRCGDGGDERADALLRRRE